MTQAIEVGQVWAHNVTRSFTLKIVAVDDRGIHYRWASGFSDRGVETCPPGDHSIRSCYVLVTPAPKPFTVHVEQVEADGPVYAGQVVYQSVVPTVPALPPHQPSPARCPRCQGPACELLYGFRCERVGGCVTAEERIGVPFTAMVIGGNMYAPEVTWLAAAARDVVPTGPLPPSDRCAVTSDHVTLLKCKGIAHGHHPTREGAIAAWREKALAAERGK